MIKKKKIVTKAESNQRLDAYIAKQETELTRTMVQKLLEAGNILVNGNVEKPSYKVKEQDVVVLEIPEPKKTHLQAQEIPLEVIYQDKDILVVNKPKGMVVHPANGNPDGTLVNAVMAICKDSLSGIGGELRPGIVHRLDKDTSGLLIVAKNDKSHLALSEQIQKHEVQKIYWALVRGIIPEQEATIHMPIGRSEKDRKKMAVTSKGKDAITHFKVLKRYTDTTLVELRIETGRTHQIRVHLAQIGHPVIGDSVYSNGKNAFDVQGQVLHAKKLIFQHPTTGKKMELEAPLPEYFQKILEKLEKEK